MLENITNLFLRLIALFGSAIILVVMAWFLILMVIFIGDIVFDLFLGK